MQAEDWQGLVDVQRLRQWMDTRHLESGPIVDLRVLTGGTQNVLVRFRRGASEFVLRRPPAHPYLDGSKTMRREARVLAALAGTEVPHPRLIASCDDIAVLGAGFYLMEPVNGFTPTGQLPAAYAAHTEWRQRIGWQLVDALAGLAALDPVAVGLADFGKLDRYLERQIVRWRDQLDSYRSYASWPGLAGVDPVQAWLEANRPRTFQAGIVHGDFSQGNAMFHADRPQLAAVIDWELSTLGDPLVDLGWLLALWPDTEGRSVVPALGMTPWQGLVHADALVARYAWRTGRDLSDLRWFRVLAYYKMAVINEGTHARALAGKAPVATGEAFHRIVLELLDRARRWIA